MKIKQDASSFLKPDERGLRRAKKSRKLPLEEHIQLVDKVEGLPIGSVCAVRLARLCPTQATVGYYQVYEGVRAFQKLSGDRLFHKLLKEPIPVVIGPDRNLYVIDHHHLAATLWALSFDFVVVEVKEKFLRSSFRTFWTAMRKRKWVHLYDEEGSELSDWRHLPKAIESLKDNPFQSLAWLARQEWAYAKSTIAVSDFKWPDFFRSRLKVKKQKSMAQLIREAVKLARSKEACGLPGYIYSC